jgi:hypothetical protein
MSIKSGTSRAALTLSLLLCCLASANAESDTCYCFDRQFGSGSCDSTYMHNDTIVRAYSQLANVRIRGWGNFNLRRLGGADPKSFTTVTLHYYERSVSNSPVCSLRYLPHLDESTWPANTVWDSVGYRGQSHYPFGSQSGTTDWHEVSLTPWDNWPSLTYTDHMAIAWLTNESGNSHEGRDDGHSMQYPPYIVFVR